MRNWILAGLLVSGVAAQAQQTALTIDAKAAATPFPHFWETTFGSGRAILSLRESYRKDLDAVKTVTNFDSVRFHGILMDEVGLYDPDRKTQNPGLAAVAANDASVYNFSYIDQIYDGLLEHHVRPFVEISFMPKKMASDPAALHAFWYKQNVSPPKDYKVWDAMMTAFAKHLVERYGIEEVSHWSFEVWNEPNLDFWAGKPAQSSYFELYDHTARALKAVNPRMRVGGPSTAQAAWVGAFLQHCKDADVPCDFASTHVYGNDTAPNVLKTPEDVPRDKMVPRAVQMVHEEILKSPYPKTPLIFSEYNASYSNEPEVTDSVFMGPWMATTISQCDGLVESMSYWSFSDVFEEQGVTRTPFYGGFGLMAEGNIPKPSYNVFAMLHELGEERLKLDSDSALLTRRKDGTLVLALWNYAPPQKGPVTGAAKVFSLTLDAKVRSASIRREDADHGNVIKAFDAMGRPATPTREQYVQLREAGKASPAEVAKIQNHQVQISIPPQGLVVMELK
jgi:xylan 1,4-beta-xylosidase